MEITVERDQNTYAVHLAGGITITTTFARSEAEIKPWVREVNRIYRKKGNRNGIVVGLSAERSFNYAHGKSRFMMIGKRKDDPYELLQICVGTHCLIFELDRCSWERFNPKSLKEFLNDNGVTVVGIGVEKFAKKLEADQGLPMPKMSELRELAQKKEDEIEGDMAENDDGDVVVIKRDFRRYDIARLARVVLGERANFVKPRKITWSVWIGPHYFDTRLSDDLVKYLSVEAFLASQMGVKLLRGANFATSASSNLSRVDGYFFDS